MTVDQVINRLVKLSDQGYGQKEVKFDANYDSRYLRVDTIIKENTLQGSTIIILKE